MPEKIELDEKDKLQILLVTLQERYKSIHTMRNRVQNICTWILGIFLFFSGLLIKFDLGLTLGQKFLFSIFLLIAYYAVKCRYIKDIENGFNSNLRVAARIEKTLKLYESNFYDSLNSSLYPDKWQHAGTEHSEGNYLNNSYWLLRIGTIFLLIAIWI